jgi:hypothetical protein
MKESRLQSDFRNLGNYENLNASLPVYSVPLKIGPQSDYGNNRWEVYSPKLQRNVTLYSNLEYDHWVLIESNPEIVFFCEQPLKIRIKLPIGVVTTIFDMWIQWKSGLEEFREVKFENDLEDSRRNSRISRQIQAQRKWCELNNKKYSIITEKSIRSNLIYLSNLKLILRHLDRESNQKKDLISERIIRMLSEQRTLAIGKIEKSFSDVESLTVRSAVFELLHKNRLTSDLENKPLDLNSIIEVADA